MVDRRDVAAGFRAADRSANRLWPGRTSPPRREDKPLHLFAGDVTRDRELVGVGDHVHEAPSVVRQRLPQASADLSGLLDADQVDADRSGGGGLVHRLMVGLIVGHSSRPSLQLDHAEGADAVSTPPSASSACPRSSTQAGVYGFTPMPPRQSAGRSGTPTAPGCAQVRTGRWWEREAELARPHHTYPLRDNSGCAANRRWSAVAVQRQLRSLRRVIPAATGAQPVPEPFAPARTWS